MPLNEPLYAVLSSRFARVRVVNDGQPRVVTHTPDPNRPGTLIRQSSQCGEQYAVDCRFCGDQRQRLYVSCDFGRRDSVTGRENNALWYCFNERCHDCPINRARLSALLTIPFGRQVRRSSPVAASGSPAVNVPAPPLKMMLPSDSRPINTLPPNHPAIAYVINRGFDPAMLWNYWRVYYCGHAGESRPAVYDRLVIPVYRPTATFANCTTDASQPFMLGGWQARAIGPLPDHLPRYLSAAGMQKSQLLYGLPQAMQCAGPVFVCEGVTDCWRIGPGAVALFGKDLSSMQKMLLVHHFAGRPLIVALDAEAAAQEQARRIVQELRLARTGGQGDNRVVLLHMPHGCNDPGECNREVLMAAGYAALEQFVQ